MHGNNEEAPATVNCGSMLLWAELLLLGNKLTTLENIIHTIGSDRVALEYHARYLDF